MPRLIDLPVSDEDVRAELVGYLCDNFQAAVKARQNQIESKYRRWLNNYAAKPAQETRTTPFVNASNFVPQLIRMHTDILSARLIGFIFGCRPMWKPTSVMDTIDNELLTQASSWMDFVGNHRIRLVQQYDSAIYRTVKTGTVVVKLPWIEDEVSYVKGMTEEGNGFDEETITVKGIQPRVIPFDDFFPYPITSENLKEVLIKFHRIRLTKSEVELRAEQGRWDKEAVKLLLEGGPDKENTGLEITSEEAGVALSEDVDRPFSAIEAWLVYPLGGRRYPMRVTFNPKLSSKDGYLQGIFNPYPPSKTLGLIDPFVDFRILPREDFFYGYCIPEILEQSQEEQAQIHNSRRDSSTISNIPGWKKRWTASIPDPNQGWFPGKVFNVESMDDLEILQFPIKYNDMIDEERYICELAERYTGAGPPTQALGAGILSGKRGIYNTGGTLAMLAEGNRRLDILTKRLRYGFHDTGRIIYHSYRLFDPASVPFSNPPSGAEIFWEISASDASANKEVDRTSLLLMANTMATYYQRIVEAGNVIVQLPKGHPLQTLMGQVLEGARDLARRLLFAFDISDRDRLLPDANEVLGTGVKTAKASSGPQQGVLPFAEGALQNGGMGNVLQMLGGLAGGSLGGPGGPQGLQ